MTSHMRICADCLKDEALKAAVDRATETPADCDYCGSNQPTLYIQNIALACDYVLKNMYRVTSLDESVWLYERTPVGEPLANILERLVGACDDVIHDLELALLEHWRDDELGEGIYGDDPWFAEGSEYETEYSAGWSEMEESLRYEARLLNPRASELLEKVFGPVLDDRTNSGEPVVIEMSPTSELSTLFRARVFQSDSALEKALAHPERFLGPPPEGLGAAGRMNARGVSVFYGATDQETALGEVRPPVGSKITIATFAALRPLRLLDLEKLSAVAERPYTSLFASGAIDKANRHSFLRKLTQSMVMPVMPESQDNGYLTTQAISDFLATHPKLNLDGIMFRSSQGASGTQHGMNVILFRKASTVLNAETDYTTTTRVTLWEEDESGTRFCPKMRTQHAATPYRRPYEHYLWTPQEPTLRLDRNSIEVLEIRGVSFTAVSHSVSNHESTLPPAGTAPPQIDF